MFSMVQATCMAPMSKDYGHSVFVAYVSIDNSLVPPWRHDQNLDTLLETGSSVIENSISVITSDTRDKLMASND